MKEDIEVRLKRGLASFLQIDERELEIEEVGGGFTGALKFKVRARDENLFVKAVSEEKEIDAFLIKKEGEMYELLRDLELVGEVFGEYRGLMINEGVSALVMDFLDGSWGGPWNEETIGELDETLKRLHETKLSDLDKQKVVELSKEIRDKLGIKVREGEKSEEEKQKEREDFLAAWNKERNGFINAKGEVYFKGDKNLTKKIIEVAEIDVPHREDQLIMHDLNFANIVFVGDHAFLVDPVFVTLGSEYFDRTVVGVNILQQLKGEASEAVKQLIGEKFIVNSTGLARLIKYYVMAAHKRVDEGGEKWQKFHQECAIEALRVLEEMTGSLKDRDQEPKKDSA